MTERDKKYRFHLLGLVHLPTSEKYMACAFSQKNVKMCKMLLALDHEVYLYGAEGSTAPCTKLIQTHSLKDIRNAWGEGDNRYSVGYNWHNKQFKHDINEKRTAATLRFYGNSIKEINKIKKPDDFLMITQGTYQKPIHDATNLYLTIESGIGYRGSYCQFRSFESSYIQNFTYGSEHPRQSINGRYYDRIMPNYFDTKDFPFKQEKEDYFLFIGRFIKRKGVFTALKATEAAGVKLKMAGQLSDEISLGELESYDHAEYVGFADVDKRADLMSNAKGVLVPSTYLEPFAGVHAEAMLCGTPVITTNFGVFPSTVQQAVNGYRCDTLQDFVHAIEAIDLIDPKMVRQTAEKFTMESVSELYQKWFDDLMNVYESTQDSNKKGWHRIE